MVSTTLYEKKRLVRELQKFTGKKFKTLKLLYSELIFQNKINNEYILINLQAISFEKCPIEKKVYLELIKYFAKQNQYDSKRGA